MHSMWLAGCHTHPDIINAHQKFKYSLSFSKGGKVFPAFYYTSPHEFSFKGSIFREVMFDGIFHLQPTNEIPVRKSYK